MELSVTTGEKGPLSHVALEEQDGSGGAKARDHERVGGRGEAFEGQRSAGGLQATGVVVVLDGQHGAVQRRHVVGAGKVFVQAIRICQGRGVEENDRCWRWVLWSYTWMRSRYCCTSAWQVAPPRAKGGLRLRKCGLFKVKGRRGRALRGGTGEGESEEGQEVSQHSVVRW